jgi:hypothetical protein
MNSHSPVVLSALIDKAGCSVEGLVLFADTSSVSDPALSEVRRRTRIRPVRSLVQPPLFGDGSDGQGYVSELEVHRILETVNTEG